MQAVLLNIFCGVVGNAVFAIFVYLKLKSNLYKKMDQLTGANELAENLRGNLSQSQQILISTQSQISQLALINPSVNFTDVNANVNNLQVTIGNCRAEVDTFRGSLRTIKVLGDKIT